MGASHEMAVGIGVGRWVLTVLREALALVGAAREAETRIRSELSAAAAERLVLEVVADGVDAAEVLERDGGLATEEPFDRCVAMAGEPQG